MANEAVLVDLLDKPLDFTVTDGTAVTKGSLMKMTTPRTAIISSASGDVVAGIAARDKIASDGRTRLAIYRRGVFRIFASGAIVAGQAVQSAGVVNKVKTAAATSSGATIVGYALMDIADNAAGHIFVDVGCGGGQVS
jgi:Uncharacterized conserved protein (DUF2190)